MKKNILVLLFACYVLGAFANPVVPSCKRLQVAKYNAPAGSTEHAFIPMSFGKSRSAAEITDKLPANAEVLAIDIVYTDFPKGGAFDALNEKRAQTLLEMYPKIAKNQIREWNLVAQTGCKTKEQAEELFHGVVVHYRVPPTIESMKSEISFLKTVGIAAKPGAESISKEKYNRMMGISAPESKSSELVATGTGVSSKESGGIFYTFAPGMNTSPEDVISTVFNRNKWSSMNISADVTGSMSPYTGQLLVWLSLQFNDKRVKQITFFNDGDMKKESQKKIGEIGGVYQGSTCDIESVRKLAIKAMAAGFGGDAPENNIEGLLKAYESNPGCKELILVADALAPVKDISLLDQVKVPVRVVLCGTYYGLHTDYLRIAYRTGGSVHTMEEDIQNLAALKEGETIKIGPRTYQIVKGTLVWIKSS